LDVLQPVTLVVLDVKMIQTSDLRTTRKRTASGLQKILVNVVTIKIRSKSVKQPAIQFVKLVAQTTQTMDTRAMIKRVAIGLKKNLLFVAT